jgi:tRNA A-37 threonylcarbamoyl transferase component Bud32
VLKLKLAPKIISFNILENYPDFLDLPWEKPLTEWENFVNTVEFEIGLHRNEVIFIDYDNNIYALKKLHKKLASHEFEMLKKLYELDIPVVKPVGYVQFKNLDNEDYGIIITEFLEFSIPFRLLFLKPKLYRYQKKMIKSISNLLVRLHIAKFYWGDCSLSNILFKRDAGELQAYLVDAETMEYYDSLSEEKKDYDLDIMSENIGGDLMDIAFANNLPPEFNFNDTTDLIRQSYLELTSKLINNIHFSVHEKFKIKQRIEEINELGFTIKEYFLKPIENEDENILVMQTIVTEKSYYKNELKNLTFIKAEENQAKIILNNILEYKADLESKIKKVIPLQVVAHQWLDLIYKHTLNQLNIDESNSNAPQIFCQVLEHKWFLSERKNQDIGLMNAIFEYNNLIKSNQIEKDELLFTNETAVIK